MFNNKDLLVLVINFYINLYGLWRYESRKKVKYERSNN